MCFADSEAERCLNCLEAVSAMEKDMIIPACYHSRNVSFLSSQGCIIRYADAPILGSADRSGVRLVLRSLAQPTDVAGMRVARGRLLSRLADMAGGDSLRFATGSQGYVDAITGLRHVVYGMAQCTRDLPLSECASCLLDHLAAMYRDGDARVANSTEASSMGFSCYLTYQLDKPINIAGIMAPAPTAVLV